MIEYAGLGVAMENAQPIVKETADFITKSNDEDGILHVINTFYGNLIIKTIKKGRLHVINCRLPLL